MVFNAIQQQQRQESDENTSEQLVKQAIEC